jgi:hypothetical protein
MTKQEWAEELEAILAADGGHWRLFKAWVELGSPMCGAELTDHKAGAERRIVLARDRFRTPPERRVEVIRQLREPPRAR